MHLVLLLGNAAAGNLIAYFSIFAQNQTKYLVLFLSKIQVVKVEL